MQILIKTRQRCRKFNKYDLNESNIALYLIQTLSIISEFGRIKKSFWQAYDIILLQYDMEIFKLWRNINSLFKTQLQANLQ